MSVGDLIAEIRTDILDDNVTPYLWSDDQLTRYANEAILEACKRAPLLKGVSVVTVVANTADYDIDNSIRQIYVAKLDSDPDPIWQATDAQLSLQFGSDWRTRTGTTRYFVRRGHTIRLFPIPTVADKLVLTTSNLPDVGFDLDQDIDSAYHRGLLYYMAYKAYSLNDADTGNKAKSGDYLSLFNTFFGLPKSAKYDIVSQESPMYATVTTGRMC